MRARVPSSAGKAASASGVSIDIVLMSLRGRQLSALTGSGGSAARGALSLPWGVRARGEHLDDAAKRIARRAAGCTPGWIEQGGAFADGTHPGGAGLSVCYVAVAPWFEPTGPWAWTPAHSPAGLTERHRRMLAAGVGIVRGRAEQAPIAFRLLPKEFTLSELQRAYEGLLSRRLHKASFRRALLASWVVEPMDEWRAEGRGRPAQLFRYTASRRKGPRRGVRFDLS